MASGGGQDYSYNESAGYNTSNNDDAFYQDSQYGSYWGDGTGKGNPRGSSWRYGETSGYPGNSGSGFSLNPGYAGGGRGANANPFGFTDWGSGRGRGGQKKNIRGNSGNGWSGGYSGNGWSQPGGGNDYYNTNAGAYAQDGYGYEMDADYSGSNPSAYSYSGGSYRANPKNPFRTRGPGSNSYHRVWKRGMPLWKGASERQAFKRKWNKKFDAFDDVRNELKNEKKKEPTDAKATKKKMVRAARVKNFKKTIAMKKKYRSVKQNKSLTFNEQLVLIFLKRIAYEMCEGEDHMVHCLNFSKLASRHPNALKIFANEAKTQMDRKYDPAVEGNVEKRKEYLREARDEIITGFKKVYKNRSEPEDIETKTALIDEYIGIVSGETFDPEKHIPTDDDMVLSKDHSRKEEDFINDIKYEFLFYCYEAFRVRVDEQKRRTKSLVRRLKFHWENAIIPFLLVECVRAKTFVKALPEPLSKYIFPQSDMHQERNISLLDSVLEHCAKNKETVVTPIAKYIAPGADYSTEVYRDFADCILMFDKFATYARFRMLKYTPHILLTPEMKENLFTELVDRVYREALDILVKNERMDTRQFEDMSADPEELEREAERLVQKEQKMKEAEKEKEAQNEGKDEEMKGGETEVKKEEVTGST